MAYINTTTGSISTRPAPKPAVTYHCGGVAGNCGAVEIYQRTTHTVWGTPVPLSKQLAKLRDHLVFVQEDKSPHLRSDPEVRKVLKGKHCIHVDGLWIFPPNNWGGPREYIQSEHTTLRPYRSDLNTRSWARPASRDGSHLWNVKTDLLPSDSGNAPDSITADFVAPHLSRILLNNKAVAYSGAYVTRSKVDGYRFNCGFFAAHLHKLLEAQEGEQLSRTTWYKLGDSDVHAAFPVPLHKNKGYTCPGQPRSGDSFCMLFYKGTNPPPITAGGFITVSKKVWRKKQ